MKKSLVIFLTFGLALLAGAFFFCRYIIQNNHAENGTVFMAIPVSGFCIVIILGLVRQFMYRGTQEHRVTRVYDICKAEEINIRFYIEQKLIDELTDKESWIRVHIVNTQEQAEKIMKNIKQGIPVTKCCVTEVLELGK